MELFVEGPIWLARYPGIALTEFMAKNPDFIYKSVPWPEMWQYTDRQHEPGTPAALDGDLYLNVLADLQTKHVLT